MQQTTKRTGLTNLSALAGSSILYRTAFASMVVLAAGGAMANPSGEQVVSGNATFDRPDASNLVINQGSDKAIINWQNFDIMQGESTRFIQPNANSVALNRVVAGQNASQILGNLTANGKIILVNPNGVFFGAGSKVDVAGMIATTADISNANFNAGKMIFDKAGRADASIINKGTITVKDGGLAALVAPGVENDGTIIANAGTITLASGSTVAVDMYGDNLYSFAVGRADAAGVNEKGETLKDGVSNKGVLQANGGTVQLTANVAKNIVTNVVNNTGVIEASGAHVVGGTVVLDGGSEGNVNIAGTINAKGSKGGNVTVTGETIKLASAKIDASGSTAGGQVRIGGDFHGAGAIAHAKTVDIDGNSLINVSAIDSGNAGSSVIWSDEATNFSGTLLGSAGAAGGNGSFSEISSAGELTFAGTGDLHGVNGTNGTLLLDPQNITIGNAAAIGIMTLLNFNSNVDIETSALPGADAGNIIVNSAINWFGNGALKLGANNNITINKNIKSTTNSTGNDGSITLQAGNDIAINNATLGTKSGYISIVGKGVQLANSIISAVSGNIDILGTGKFSDDTAGSIHNDATKGGHIAINQSTAGSIQNAVDAIGSYGSGGAKVTLGSGNFNEQVSIIGKSNFTLTGQGAGSTTISSPDSLTTLFNNGNPIKAVVGVKDGDNVTLSNFTVDGLNKGDANYRFTGIAYDNAGGRITGTTVTNIEGNPANGVQGGNGIYAYVDIGSHNLEIDHNNVNHFQKTGIVLNGSGLTGNVHHNTVTGLGAVDFIAQNGIQFGFGATGTIYGNTISGIGYTPDSYEAAGILLYQAGTGVEVRNNTIDGAGYAAGIDAFETSHLNIHDNVIKNVQDGIVAVDADTVTAKNNTITGATNNGVQFEGVTHGFITGNLIHDTGSNAINAIGSNGIDIAGNYIGYSAKGGAWGAAGNIKGDGINVDDSDNAIIHANVIAQTASTAFDNGSGIHVTNSDGVTIGGATLADGNKLNNIAWDGIKLGNDTNVTVQNNKLEHIGRVGIYLGSVDTALIANNKITSAEDNLAGYGAIAADFGSNLTITGNSIFNNTHGNGVYLNAVASGTNSITGNIINGVTDNGVYATGSNNLDVSGNTIMRTGQDGVHLENIQNASITANDIHDIGGDGIHATNLTLNGASQTIIADNGITKTSGNGIYLDGVTNANVTGNVVYVVGGNGIEAHNLTTADTFSNPGQNIIAGNKIRNTVVDGILVDTATNLVVVENLVHDVRNFGIKISNAFVSGVNSTIVAANEIYSAGFNGIDLDGIDNAYVVNNNIYAIGPSHGYFPDGAPDASLNYGDGIHAVNLRSVGNSAPIFLPFSLGSAIVGATGYGTNEGVTDYASEFSGASGSTTISNNYINNVDHDGIHVEGAVNTTIDNNTVISTGNDGIYATNLTIGGSDSFKGFFLGTLSGSTDVSYNDVSNNGHDGIHLDGVTNGNVTNNLVRGTGNDGIFAANFDVTTDTILEFNPGDSSEGGSFFFDFVDVSAETAISNNTVYNNNHDGIHAENIANANINGNLVHDLLNDGISGTNLYRVGYVSKNEDGTTNKGSTQINENEAYNIANDGIHLDTVENLNATFNNVHDLSHDGIFGTNLYTNSVPALDYRSVIDHNTVKGIGHDGIHVESIQNASVTSNKIDLITNHGIFAANPTSGPQVPTGDDSSEGGDQDSFFLKKLVTPTGNGSFDNAYFGSNLINNVGADGIHLEGMDFSETAFNQIHGAGNGAGIYVFDSLFDGVRSIHDNLVTNSALGISLEQSNVANVLDNTLTDNGIGVQLNASNLGLLQGNVFTGNTLGINLENSQTTFIVDNSITTPIDGVGLRIASGSGGTRVFSTEFNGGNVAIELTDAGSEMQFGDDQSTFTGNNFYFVLQNGAMFGDVLDASQQTFDGVRAADFTQAQPADAENNHTIDVAHDGSLGDVFYTQFLPWGFDTGLLDDFLSNRRNAYRRGNFSYAGRSMNFITDPIEPGSFDPRNASLSLLNRANPTAAADIANLFANLAPAAGGNKPLTPQQLAALGPAAGGAPNAQQYASLAPAAGGAAGGCGNSFLGDGFNTGFSCGAQ